MIKNIIASATLATSMLVSSFASGQEQSQVTIEFENFAVRGVSIEALELDGTATSTDHVSVVGSLSISGGIRVPADGSCYRSQSRYYCDVRVSNHLLRLELVVVRDRTSGKVQLIRYDDSVLATGQAEVQ